MEVVPEVTSHNIDDNDCTAVLPNDYCDDFLFLQEMEMGEKPKKAPEQTAMVKMGMLGTPTIFTTVISPLL